MKLYVHTDQIQLFIVFIYCVILFGDLNASTDCIVIFGDLNAITNQNT